MATNHATQLLDALTELYTLADDSHEPTAAQELRDLIGRVRSHEFRLAVAGQFKRGKSTVVNALVGAPVLPTDVLPLSSVPAFLRAGQALSTTVIFENGRTEMIAPDRIVDYATEIGNPGNRLGVQHIDVMVPGRFLASHLCFIDLPGIGSTIDANSAVARQALDAVDAVLFVLGADPPITAEERRFLAELARVVPRVFVAQNKRDLFDDGEWARATAFNAAVIQQILGHAVILSVSAKEALRGKMHGDVARVEAAGWPALESHLIRFLDEDRMSVWRASIHARVAAVVTPVLQRMAVRRAALNIPRDNLQQQVQLLDAHLEDLRLMRDDTAVLLRRDVERELRRMADRLKDWALTCISDLERSLAGRTEGSVREWDTAIVDAVRQSAEEVATQEMERWETWWQTRMRDLQDRGTGLLTKIQFAYKEALGIEWGALESLTLPRVALATRSMDFDRQSFFPELSWGALAPILPLPIRRVVHAKRLRTRLPDVVDRFRGRVRQGVAQAMEQVFSDVVSRFDGEISGLQWRLRSALDQALADLESKDAALPELRAQALLTERAWQDRLAAVSVALEQATELQDPSTPDAPSPWG
jgi:signal recognition particle receptor subunit beta